MAVQSYAKINLFLKVGKKMKNNYHQIQSVMQKVELSDTIHIEHLAEDKIVLESTNKELENEDNLAYKAAALLKAKFKVKQGVKIRIEKNIPLESGLGGGSSNAAAVLNSLNKMWGLKISQKNLMELGFHLGSDVPFLIGENASIVEGIGDKVKPLKKSFSINVVLINPGFRVPTKWAYAAWDKQKPRTKTKADINALVKAIEKKDIGAIADNMHNDFEEIVFKKHKVLKEIKQNLMRNDALNATVSGSGPTIFAVFNSIYEAREAFFKIQYDYPFVFLTKTI